MELIFKKNFLLSGRVDHKKILFGGEVNPKTKQIFRLATELSLKKQLYGSNTSTAIILGLRIICKQKAVWYAPMVLIFYSGLSVDNLLNRGQLILDYT